MVQYFTKEGLQNLKDELKDLKENKISETKKLIAEARAFGDLKENAGYHDAREKMSFLLGRVEQLECAINESVICEKKDDGKIQLGSEVTLMFGNDQCIYNMTAPTDADILKNKISYMSPLGQCLMGKRACESFDFQVNGKNVKIKIVKIQ